MDLEYGGILIVPTIVGLVEAAKRLGLPVAYAPPLAVGIGLTISVGYAVAADLPGGTEVADATLRGLALGLSSAGLYSTVRQGLTGRDVAGGRPARGAGRAGRASGPS